MEGCAAMSFLKPLGAETAPANPAAAGVGNLFGTDGAHISSIADRIGTGMNQIATAGGAQPGYAAQANPTTAQPAAPPPNHLQMLDPSVLQSLIQQFRPNIRTQSV
jgi:hypothetical protein